MGCINRMNPKTQINVITSNNMIQDMNKEKILKKEEQIQIYHNKNSEEVNRQTNISQKIESIIDNNPLPFVKIKKKKY